LASRNGDARLERLVFPSRASRAMFLDRLELLAFDDVEVAAGFFSA